MDELVEKSVISHEVLHTRYSTACKVIDSFLLPITAAICLAPRHYPGGESQTPKCEPRCNNAMKLIVAPSLGISLLHGMQWAARAVCSIRTLLTSDLAAHAD
jgi:hypothetical protein